MNSKLYASRAQPAAVPGARPARGPAAPLTGSHAGAQRVRGPTRRVCRPRAEAVHASKPAGAPRLYSDDAIKEESRRLARPVFDHDAWQAHRSAGRYTRHIAGILESRTMVGLMRPLAYVVGVSTAAVALEAARLAGALPAWLPSLQISTQLFGLTSFALSLLLVFRTNASYERWDGARKTWGLVLNRSRDLARQGLTHISQEKAELRAMLVRWVPAFSKALMCHLRRDDDLRQELAGLLTPDEAEQVLRAQHRPNYVLQVLSEIVKAGALPSAPAMKMEENLTAFEDCLGGCERILKTPIPLSYTRHTSRMLMIWLTLLPFALLGPCGVTTIPMCAIVAFLLLGIEEIGVSIEEPFSILPLEAICDSVAKNVAELQAAYIGAAAAAAGAALPLAASALVARGAGARAERAFEDGNGAAAGAGLLVGGGAAAAPPARQPRPAGELVSSR